MAPRSIWKGAISFGLVTIPVKLFTATEEKDISFRQVHPADEGRIKYKRVCDTCGNEIPYAEIGKGYEMPDGRMVILESEDFDHLPLATTKSVEVVQFVPADQVDPTYFDKTYFLQADGPGAKPYVLLRDALIKSGQAAIVKVAIRSREQLAMIRPVDRVLRMHTMLWPDEVRNGEFAEPPAEVTVSDSEVEMAQSFIDALAGDFEPEAHSDAYRIALEEVIESKLSGMPAAETEEDEGPGEAEVVDLVAALRASVEAAKKRREAASAKDSEDDDEADDSEETTKASAKKSASKKAPAKRAATKKAASKKTASKKAASRAKAS
ncbi:Ku protein [Propionibacteriaceae bacterium Y1700]|uniref:non-homologous end joining protein Ku n=1 Tax=Microlunatus sp. Y1700 TaxID=3418487 RepID=UPI003DA70FD0